MTWNIGERHGQSAAAAAPAIGNLIRSEPVDDSNYNQEIDE